MNRQEIEEKVKSFLIEDIEVDEEKIFPDAKLKDDLGIDSLDFLDVVVLVNKKIRLQDPTGGYGGRGHVLQVL